MVAAAAAVALAGCGSATTEVEGAARATTAPLPPPTFPGSAPGGGARGTGGTAASAGPVDASELIRRIDALTTEQDLCTLLTGQAAAISSVDVNLASVASNPSALAQLFASFDKLFAHMVTIAPPEVQPPLATTQQLWQTASTLDLQDPAAQQQWEQLIVGDDVQQAQAQLAAWIPLNCT
jgi:hypothetical protein